MRNNEPAFPGVLWDRDSIGEVVPRESYAGMALRDAFAIAALTFFVTQDSSEDAAENSYAYADAMIEARESKP